MKMHLFNTQIINRLFPFHLLINRNLVIQSCGKSMKKLHGNCIGRSFIDCFQLMRPVETVIDFNKLFKLTDTLVIIKTRDGRETTTLIKGQFEYLEGDDQLLFIGTPWFNSLEQLRMTNLMLNDFAHHCPTIDLLHQIKTQDIVNDDLKRLVETINEQKNKLKKGEKNILSSLEKERELNQLKSSFVSLASHEFRTPLSCIRSSIELMQINAERPGVPLSDIKRHQNNILLEVDHLSRLIDEVLTVGKIESNSFRCKKQRIDIEIFLQEIIKKIIPIQEDGRSVSVFIYGTAQPVMADHLMLTHIITNLLSNAFKYSKGKSQPIVTLFYEAEGLKMKIKDYGIGIPFGDQSKIFQAFFRAENVNNISGTGLGMFITKSFIELHDGQITFKSIPEKGSEFTIWLPLN